jgi:hypothetical protein
MESLMPDLEQTVEQSSTQRVRYACYRVAVTQGADTGKQMQGAGMTLRVGSAPSAEMRLTDVTVSRLNTNRD